MTHLDKLLQSIPLELHQPSRAFLEAGDQIGLYWWYWFREGNLLFLSPGLIRELGHDPETYDPSHPGKPDNIHPRDVRRNREFFMQLVRGHGSKYELTYRVRDGKKGWKWFYNRGVVMPGKPGAGVSVIAGITLDLSGRFQNLLTQVEDSEKFEFLFRHNTEAALIIEIRDGILGRVLDANQAARDLFGEDTPQMKGEMMLDEGEDDMFRHDGPLLSQLKRKGYLHFERKMNLAYRGEVWLEFHVHLFNKTSEDLILALVSDNTSGKRTEAALRDSERLYKTLFEAADDRIVLFDETGQTLFFSRSYYKALGYSRKEFEALDDVQVIHTDDLARLRQEGRTLFETGSSAHEYRVRHKDGTYLDMASKNVLIPTDPGEKRLILSVSRDVSQRKRDMEELREAKERAEESDRLKSAFLANMSHEIRTPMNSIMGFSNLLEDEDLGPGERIMYIQRITRNTENLLKLISDIIDLSKIESGQFPLVIGKLKVGRLLEELREYALDEIARKGKDEVEVHLHLELGDRYLAVDVVRLVQAMKNLVNNAIKFTTSGRVDIGCRSAEEENHLLLYVQDTGIGIAQEHFELIFEQFRQVDDSHTRRFGGAGLGLSISRNLIHMMGGRIWLESSPGAGTSFLVELPLAEKGDQVAPEKGPARQSLFGRMEGVNTILVVDDETDTLILFQALLGRMGYKVLKASNGYEALRLLELGSLPDLIFMDIQMPVLSGIDTLKIIRERYPKLKVVAQSAHALEGDRARFLAQGFDAYLSKPIVRPELNRVLEELLPRGL